MKKLFVAIAVMAISISASAQVVKKGTIVVNPTLTNVSYNSFNLTSSFTDEDGTYTDTQKASRMGLQVSGGYGIQDNLLAVAALGYQSGSSDDESLNGTTLAAGVKYYFNNFYATGLLGAVNGTLKYAGESKVKATTVSLGAGYSYFLSPKVSIEPSVTYQKSLSVTVDDLDDMNLSFSGLSFNVGFCIYL